MANATLFIYFYFADLVLRRVHSTYSSVFCLGVAWWCGREVVWRLVCFGSALRRLWFGFKSAEDCATRQCGSTMWTVNSSLGRFAYKLHLLPNNPARQQCCYTSVPIEAAKNRNFVLTFFLSNHSCNIRYINTGITFFVAGFFRPPKEPLTVHPVKRGGGGDAM